MGTKSRRMYDCMRELATWTFVDALESRIEKGTRAIVEEGSHKQRIVEKSWRGICPQRIRGFLPCSLLRIDVGCKCPITAGNK